MNFTHIYDLIGKILSMVMAVCLIIPLIEYLQYPIVIMVVLLTAYLLIYRNLVSHFSTYLYCRFKLKMPVTLHQIKPLNRLLSPVLLVDEHWVELKLVAFLPENERYDAAIRIAETCYSRKQLIKKSEIQKFIKSSFGFKVGVILFILLVIYTALASVFDWFPADVINRYLETIVGVRSEVNMLTFVLLASGLTGIFYLMNKEIIRWGRWLK